MDKQLTKVLCISSSYDNLCLYELIITHIMEQKSLQFIGAVDGREGFQKAIEIKPDLLISDSYISNVGDYDFEFGWLLSEKVRRELSPHILGAIMLERRRDYDWTPSDDWIEWIRAPLNEVIMKPVDPDELVKKVNLLLDVVARTRAQ